MKRKHLPPIHERKAAVIANWKRGDDSESSRILTQEMGIPTGRSAVQTWRLGGYSKLELKYVEAMETAQARRAKAATQAG